MIIVFVFLRSRIHHEEGSGIPRNFVRGRGEVFQQIQLSTEDRENGDLGAVAPLVRGVLEAALIWYKKFYFM